MGKWATYRRRGSCTEPPALLPAPPQPELAQLDSDLMQTRTGSDDVGGVVYLERADAEGGPYHDHGTTDWDNPVIWNSFVALTDGWYRARESGNGVLFAGFSAWSVPLHYEE